MAITEIPLIQGQDIKDLLGQGGTANDAVMDVLAGAASAYVKMTCGQNFVDGTYTERISGKGKSVVYVNEDSISSITSIIDDGSTLPSTQYDFDGNMIWMDDNVFSSVRRGVTVTYVHVGGQSLSNAAQAAKLIGAYTFSRRLTMGKTAESLGGPGGSITIDKNDVPLEAQAIIDKLVRTWNIGI